MKPVRVLGIVPYQEMRDLMVELAAGRDDIVLDAYVGDHRDCIRILEDNLHKDYEVILSRGGTASELMKRIRHTPVVDISVSDYDLMRSLRLAQNPGVPFAVIGYAPLTAAFEKIRNLQQDDFPIYTASSEPETIETLHQCISKGIGLTICGVIAYQHSLRLGIPSILVTSGSECINQAFDRAVLLSGYYRDMHQELFFYKNILRSHDRQTIIISMDGRILFSTAEYDLSEKICSHSKKEISLTMKYGSCNFYKTIGDVQYSLRSTKEAYNDMPCCSFEFEPTRIPVKISRYGITYTSRNAVEEELRTSNILSLFTKEDMNRLEALQRSSAPVAIVGEAYCYKSTIAKYLYQKSSRSNSPLIIIDCGSLDYKGWQFLLVNEDSPLNENGCSILIDNITYLDEQRRQYLLNHMISGMLCKRNRVYFVHTISPDPAAKSFMSLLVNELHALTWKVPPLRERTGQIDTYISTYLSRMNQNSASPVFAMDPQAGELLRSWQWKQNYRQLERILERVYYNAGNGAITAAEVSAALADEEDLQIASDEHKETKGSVSSGYDLDFSRPLEEIKRAIAMIVLEECGGNQRAAAKRMQISRTTLWHMLNKTE